MPNVRKELIVTIQNLLNAEAGIEPSTIDAVIDAIRQNGKNKMVQRTMISSKRVMEILDCSFPHLKTLVEQGKLHVVKYSERKTRYYEDEVINLQQYGDSAYNQEAV